MIEIKPSRSFLSGPKGTLAVREDDEITLRLAMLFEGQCEGLNPVRPQKNSATHDNDTIKF